MESDHHLKAGKRCEAQAPPPAMPIRSPSRRSRGLQVSLPVFVAAKSPSIITARSRAAEHGSSIVRAVLSLAVSSNHLFTYLNRHLLRLILSAASQVYCEYLAAYLLPWKANGLLYNAVRLGRTSRSVEPVEEAAEPDIEPLPDLNLDEREPLKLRPFKPLYHLTMGRLPLAAGKTCAS